MKLFLYNKVKIISQNKKVREGENSSDYSKNKKREKMSTPNEKNDNSKKVDEPSYTDSGFHSGIVDSEVEAIDNETGLQGNSQDKEFNEDDKRISNESLSKPGIDRREYVPDYLYGLIKRQPYNSQIDKYFVQNDDGFNQLHITILCEMEKEANILINVVPVSSYLDVKNFSGKTALHLAVETSQPRLVRKLIDAGANINSRDNRCNTALHLACLNKDELCIQTIISAIDSQKDRRLLANLELWNYEGETCFYLATKSLDLSIMKTLAASGANVNAREGRAGYSALHLAVENKANDVIEFLCEDCKSTNIDIENYAGLTAFQVSLLTNQEKIAQYLISKGATPYFTAEDSDLDDDMSDYSSDELERNQIISKIAEIAVN